MKKLKDLKEGDILYFSKNDLCIEEYTLFKHGNYYTFETPSSNFTLSKLEAENLLQGSAETYKEAVQILIKNLESTLSFYKKELENL